MRGPDLKRETSAGNARRAIKIYDDPSETLGLDLKRWLRFQNRRHVFSLRDKLFATRAADFKRAPLFLKSLTSVLNSGGLPEMLAMDLKSASSISDGRRSSKIRDPRFKSAATLTF